MKILILPFESVKCMENLLNNEELDWLIKFLSGKGSNDEIIEKIVRITTKLEKMKRR